MKSFFLAVILSFSFTTFGASVMVCEDFGISSNEGPVDIRLEVMKVNPIQYSALMTLSQDGNFKKAFKQSSFYLWSTFGAEVLLADGKYFEVSKDGTESEIAGTEFTISRMVTPEARGMVSISLKATEKISYISRSCR